jgi:hypothetical protein
MKMKPIKFKLDKKKAKKIISNMQDNLSKMDKWIEEVFNIDDLDISLEDNKKSRKK